jgi:hypothetical protein
MEYRTSAMNLARAFYSSLQLSDAEKFRENVEIRRGVSMSSSTTRGR